MWLPFKCILYFLSSLLAYKTDESVIPIYGLQNSVSFYFQLENELREAQDGIYLKLGKTPEKKEDDKK